MKDARLSILSLVTALFLLSLTAVSAKAQETSAEFLSDLHDFRISNYMALDAFYSFSATGDTDTLNRIVVSINNANDSMNSVISSTSGVLSEDQVEGLNQEFDQFKNLMRGNINEVRDRGYPDLRLMADLATQASNLNNQASELYAISQEKSGVATSDRVESARSAAVIMVQMMSRYAARSNSSVSQTFQGASSDVPLDEQAIAFEKQLSSARSGSPTGELKAALDDVAAKWQFIRSSYINYNDNNVSFIIDRYSKGIIEGLENAIDLMGATS